MTFVPTLDAAPLDGVLRYVNAEHSFSFDVGSPVELIDRAGPDGLTSLSVGTLQIEVGVATGRALFAWGLHPRTNWQRMSVGRPNAEPGAVRVDTAEPLQRGVSLQLASVGAWPTGFDEDSGWLRVAGDLDAVSEQDVLIASGVVLGLSAGQLRTIWLQPAFD